jgi:hypothetical protein
MANIAANIASPQFGAVVLATLGIGFQVLVHGFRFPGIGRGSVFGKGFHDKANPAYTNLLEEHKKATGEDKLPTNGYPDMGTGRYAQLLPYKQWLEFANAQRIHVRKKTTPHPCCLCKCAPHLLINPPSIALALSVYHSTTMLRAPHLPSYSAWLLVSTTLSTPPTLQHCTLWAGRCLHGVTQRAPTKGSTGPCCLTLRCWQC